MFLGRGAQFLVAFGKETFINSMTSGAETAGSEARRPALEEAAGAVPGGGCRHALYSDEVRVIGHSENEHSKNPHVIRA
jgi:hypothetical protein